MSKLIYILLFVILLLGVSFSLIDFIPPASLTVTHMSVTKRRLLDYAHQHNTLPTTLVELPPMPGYDSKISDGWGRSLDYSVDSAGVVTLRSFGADKLPGGEGDKRDVIAIFHSRDASGNWQDGLVEWDQDPIKALRNSSN